MDTAPLRAEEDRLRLLAIIDEAFADAGPDTERALVVVARALAEQFGDGCGIALADEPSTTGGWHRDPALARQIHATFAAQSRPGFDGLNGRVLRTGQALRLARTTPQESRPFVPPDLLPILTRLGFHSVLLIPLRVPGRTIGVLTALRDRTPAGYTTAEQALVQELADHLALASTAANLDRATREVAQLTERERHQREAIAAVSHDLRTPLAAINIALGLLDASAADQLDANGAELLATARRNTQRLVILIEDLLAMNQIDAGVLELRRVPLDLRAIAEDVAQGLGPLFAEKEQHLRLDLPATLAAYGDARRIEQVLTNLLANSQRHTPPGARITITGDSGAAEAHLAIADNGHGIPPHLLEQIFTRHHRREAAGGSGIGLATARALVERHGGRLWAENAPTRGAIFRLTLPNAPSN